MTNLAIYIHWPFCKAKCPYCDFNSHVAQNIEHDLWKSSYVENISYFENAIKGKNITSVFFGGGTPTLMQPAVADAILNKLAALASFADDIEITLEGNPTSVEANKFREFKNAGVNRVSLGVQSLIDRDLGFLGREHSSNEALKAVESAADIFDNYSFDLIYARPQQGLKNWEAELLSALKYAKHHLSLYQLTIEKGTNFFSEYKTGRFTMPDEELSAEFFELTNDIMDEAGYPAYEVSNHAKPGMHSRHNMTYWQYGDYLGLGPGAHSRITDERKTALMMLHNPDNWLKSIRENNGGIQNKTPLTDREILEEAVMMGLRVKDGITREAFGHLTSSSFEDGLQNLEQMAQAGLIELDNQGLRVTKAGLPILNSVTGKLLG